MAILETISACRCCLMKSGTENEAEVMQRGNLEFSYSQKQALFFTHGFVSTDQNRSTLLDES